MLAVMAELLDDELTRARLRHEVSQRGHQLPRWLARLPEVDVYQTTEMVHVLGDGDDLLLGVRLADGRELTAVVYVDHNVGTIVKDAFFADRSIDELIRLGHEKAEPDTDWLPLDPADARARVTECIARAEQVVPPFETETWPTSRPLVEWLVRQLPEGGTPYVMREWRDDERDAVAERFLDSEPGRPFDDDIHRTCWTRSCSSAWATACAIRCAGVPWDRDPPARLDPADDRRAVAPARRTPRAPAQYVRFCGGELQLPAMDPRDPRRHRRLQPQYLDLLADLAPYSYAELTHEWLGRQVGGDEALAKLDDDPLPDEPFGWDGIPDDVCDRVREVLDECDRCAAELFDVEYRTACRRSSPRSRWPSRSSSAAGPGPSPPRRRSAGSWGRPTTRCRGTAA